MAVEAVARDQARTQAGPWLGSILIVLLGASLLLFGYFQMDPIHQKVSQVAVFLAMSGPLSAALVLPHHLLTLLETAQGTQPGLQSTAAAATFCLGSLLVLAGAVVLLLQITAARSETSSPG